CTTCDQICDQAPSLPRARQVQRFADERGNQLGGLPILTCGSVSVDLKGHAQVRVADAVADDLRCDTAIQRQRGVGVPDVVQSDPAYSGQIDLPVESASDRVCVQWPPV